jgi:hypothetical protein
VVPLWAQPRIAYGRTAGNAGMLAPPTGFGGSNRFFSCFDQRIDHMVFILKNDSESFATKRSSGSQAAPVHTMSLSPPQWNRGNSVVLPDLAAPLESGGLGEGRGRN